MKHQALRNECGRPLRKVSRIELVRVAFAEVGQILSGEASAFQETLELKRSSQALSPTGFNYFGDYGLISEIARSGVLGKARQVSLNRTLAASETCLRHGCWRCSQYQYGVF